MRKVNFSGFTKRFRKQKGAVVQRKKKYANPVFEEWKKAAVEEIAGRKIVSLVVGRCIVSLVVVCVVFASFFLTGHYRKAGEESISQVLSLCNSTLNEYGNIVREIETYEKYANMRLKVPLYVQLSILTSSSKTGFFIDSVSFEQTSDIGSLRESFVVETGKNTDSVKIVGVWKLKGLLTGEADNRWVISFKDTVEGMFSLFGVRSYVSASLKGRDFEATVIVYES